MFSVNDYVLYGSEGVCKVDSIGTPAISGLDDQKQYYTLLPVYKSGKIYTPVDSSILMRSVITKQAAQKLVDKIPHINAELDVPKDAKLAMSFYKNLIRTYECENLIMIIKHVFEKQRAFIELRKNIPAVDLKYMKIAQDMLYGELGFALELDPKEVKSYIERKCSEQYRYCNDAAV